MNSRWTGPMLGVALSVLFSTMGVVTARVLGGDIVTAATLIHSAASVVLLVTVLFRLESRPE